jgi:hypothetical protein
LCALSDRDQNRAAAPRFTWCCSVEATDSRDLRLEVGIRGMEPVADTVRAPAAGSEHAPDCTAAHPLAAALVQGVCDRLVGPHVAKYHAVVCRTLTRQRDDLAPRLQRYARWPAAPRRVKERLDARTGFPAGSPLAHEAVAAPDEPGDPCRAVPVRKPDDDPRADDYVMLSMPPPRDRLEARPLASRDAYSSRSRTGIHVPSIHEGRLSFP